MGNLGYATTTHGVQGDTLTASHVAVGDTTSAANAYVGMTRGRENDTAHLVAADVAEARDTYQAADQRAQAAAQALAQRTEQLAGQVREQWQAERPAAHDAATVIQAGPGRFGFHRGRVEAARTDLAAWAQRWAAAIPDLANPERAEHPAAIRDARDAEQHWLAATQAHENALTSQARVGNGWPRAQARDLPRLTQATEQASQRHNTADRQIRHLVSDPVIADRPNARECVAGLAAGWQGERDAEQIAQQTAAWQRQNELSNQRLHNHTHHMPYQGPNVVRGGPGIGM